MSPFYRQLAHCILCRSTHLEVAVPLAPMPAATPTFVVPDALRSNEQAYAAVPLELMLCGDCGHLQTSHLIDPEFNYCHYIYKTSSSLGLVEHFGRLAASVLALTTPSPNALVVEIGSNDGSLLRFFKHAGLRVLGIDPARSIAEDATRNGIPTLADFFTPERAEEIAAEHGRAAILLANNVIANIEDVGIFTQGLDPLLAEDGVFVFETQYGADVIQHLLLDTVYNEHLSYFMLRPLAGHFARHGYQVIDVERIPTKGGSIRVTVQRAGAARTPTPAVAAMIAEEERAGMFSQLFYQGFLERISSHRQALHALIDEQERLGKAVAGYGASVGTSTLLHQFGLIGRIHSLFDDNPDKEATLRGPGYALPVLPASAVLQEDPGAIIVFAWRYATPIIAKHQEYLKRGGRFIIPLPEVAVIAEP